MGKHNQQQLLKAVAIYPGNPDQHCPFVLKPPLIADVSESWYFRPTQQQHQVTVWAIFKLFEVDLRSQMIQKIILVGRAQAVIYIWYASEGRRHTRHSSSTLYYTMWRYVCTIPHTTPFDALYNTIPCDTLYYTISCDTLHYTVPCDTMYYIAQLHHYDTDTGTWCSAKVLAPTKICFIAKISKALSNH